MPHWKILSVVAAVLVVLLLLAWFDGGEEPLRPIVEEIPVPEAVD